MPRKVSVMKRVGRVLKATAKKRYMNKDKSLKIGQIAKDVMQLKALVNAEKKMFIQKNTGVYSANVGQVNGNANGTWSLDLTPNMAQGTTASTRNGDSIKLHSSYLRFQFLKQANATQPVRLSIDIYRVNGQPFGSILTAYSTIFKPNDFISTPALYDFQSLRDNDYFKNFTLIRSKKVFIQETDLASQPVLKNVSIPIKYKGHHVKWDNITGTPSAGQLVIVIRSDSGNMSGATASTVSGIPVVGINTGVSFGYVFHHYYYDN